MFDKYDVGQQVFVGLPICLVMLISGMIVSMLWAANMMKNGSVGLTALCYAIYIITTSIAFGWIFAVGMVQSQAYWLPVIFAVVGAIFLIATMIAKVISINGIITMGKIIFAVGIVMALFFLMFFIILLVMIFSPTAGIISGDILCTGIMMGMSIVSFLYIVIDIWQISKISEFATTTGQEYSKILPWFLGYRLLTDLVNLLFIVVLYIIRFGSRR